MEKAREPFGLLGRRLGHSWSPKIHALLGSSPYGLFEREPDEVEGFLRGGDWRGLNVTIPYKVEAARLADEKSPRVLRTGAANTLVRGADGTIVADNTDVLGFAWLLDRFCSERVGAEARDVLGGAEVLVLGSGGASKAVVAALEDVGAVPCLISRSGDDGYDTIPGRHAEARLVVNATPVGMYPDCPDSPLSEETLADLPKLVGAVDIVYNPRRTGLCLAAERLGIPAESGLPMLVAQAYFASEEFQRRDLDPALIGEVLGAISGETDNVVLIGMPGSGKTSTGKRLARMLGRPFVDLDDAVEAQSGRTPASIIREFGEAAFRDVETEVARDYGGRSGLVIACGGGIVTQGRNYDLLHQNGTIFMLDRPLGELGVKGRPLSADRGVERLAQERMPAYLSWADHVIRCTGSPAGDASEIKSHLDKLYNRKLS